MWTSLLAIKRGLSKCMFLFVVYDSINVDVFLKYAKSF